jgi:hypothetical protein
VAPKSSLAKVKTKCTANFIWPAIGDVRKTRFALGHADAKTVLRYQHPDVLKMREQLENVKTNGRVM